MRTQNEPSLQNHTDPIATQRKKVQIGRFVLTLISCLAAIAACVWIGIAVYGISTGT
jgi:hypothetical protein